MAVVALAIGLLLNVPLLLADAEPGPLATYYHKLPDGRVHEYWSWGVDVLNAPYLWDQGYTGKGVKVAIVDTASYFPNPYLQDSLVWSKDFCNEPGDALGHGTMVAGVVKQMAPDVSLYAVKYNGAPADMVVEHGYPTCAPMVDVVYAAAAGPDETLGTDDDADIITMSFEWIAEGNVPIVDPDPFEALTVRGIHLVAGAGNSWPAPMLAPAVYPSVIGAAATGSVLGGGFEDLMWELSSEGITDGDDSTISFEEVEVAAPGTWIVTTDSNGLLTSGQGTSFSAPHISGLLALLQQARPDLSDAETRAHLHCASRDLAANGKHTAPGYDISSGYGLPDAQRLLSGPCHAPVPAGELPALVVQRGQALESSLTNAAQMGLDSDERAPLVAASLTGSATCTRDQPCLAASGAGGASCGRLVGDTGCYAVSGVGNSEGVFAVSGAGNADGNAAYSGSAISGTGDASCTGSNGCTAISVTGRASCSGSPECTESSACNLNEAACIDPV
jgi:hypothetical protein